MRYFLILLSIVGIVMLFYYHPVNHNDDNKIEEEIKNNVMTGSELETELKEAYFAWGCFWCMESIFEAQEWVKEAISGYIWGTEEEATYETVSTWKTKHRESIKVVYNPDVISYKTLVEIFWKQIDPTDKWGQFSDRGFQYTTAIYYKDDVEKSIANKSKDYLENSWKFDKDIATVIIPFSEFFEAEEYHQDYYKKNSTRYKLYSEWSGREGYKIWTWNDFKFEMNDKSRYLDYTPERLKNAEEEFIVLFFHASWCPICRAFEEKVLTQEIPENMVILKVDFDTNLELRKKYNILTQTSFVLIDNEWNLKKRWIWGKSIEDVIEQTEDLSDVPKIYTDEELKKMLTPMQYKVTQEWGTEPPFDNEYWDNHEEWIYVDVIDWTPLFSSTDKFDSGTGWPSFTKPIDENFVSEKGDDSLGMNRTEIRSDSSHLWHVFNDWPKDEWGLRYCINSAALKFIPKEDLEKEWYWRYLILFDK